MDIKNNKPTNHEKQINARMPKLKNLSNKMHPQGFIYMTRGVIEDNQHRRQTSAYFYTIKPF